MAADVSLEEIRERAARQQQRDAVQPKSAPDTGATRLAAVPETDHSDLRKYCIGISNIDRDLGVLRPKGFTLLGALTGYGKTTLAEMTATANAGRYRVVYAALEPREEELRDSIRARMMGLSLEHAAEECRRQTDKYRAACERMEALDLTFWRPRAASARTSTAAIKAALSLEADFLIIDQARRMDDWVPGNTANRIAKYFSEAVAETGLHLMLLAQLKFEIARTGKRPTLDDFADSTQLPQEADRVLMLHRPFHAKSNDTVTEVVCPKNRRGKVFCGHTTWGGSLRTYFAMDDEEEQQVKCCGKSAAKQGAARKAQRPAKGATALPPPVHDDEPEYRPEDLNFNNDEFPGYEGHE